MQFDCFIAATFITRLVVILLRPLDLARGWTEIGPLVGGVDTNARRWYLLRGAEHLFVVADSEGCVTIVRCLNELVPTITI